MKKLARLTALIGVLILASGAPAYARGGGGHGGGGHFGGGGGHFGGGAGVGGGHAFGGPHGGFGGHHGFEGHHGFDGHRGFDGHHFNHDGHGRAFIGFGPYWGPYWDPYWGYPPYGPYAYAPSAPSVEAPPVYIEKPQAGYCPSGQANYADVQSCAQPWMHVAPHAG